MTDENLEAVEATVEEMKSEESFDLLNTLEQVSYPKGEVTVYTDGENAGLLEETLEKIAELGYESAKLAAGANGGIADSEGKAEIDEEIAELQELEKELIAKVSGSALTFHMRGVAPEQWRLIVRKWRRKFKPADKTDEDQVTDAQENQINSVDIELVSKAVVKIVNSKGQEDKRAVTFETAEKLKGILVQSEWERVLEKANVLTFSNSLFHNVKAADADFLSQP